MKRFFAIGLVLLATQAMAWTPEYFPPGSFSYPDDGKLEAALDHCSKIDHMGTPEGLAYIQDCLSRVILRGLADAAAADEADVRRRKLEPKKVEPRHDDSVNGYGAAAERWRKKMADGE